MDNNNQVQQPEKKVPVPEEKKSALTKVFAIVGFIAIIILMVWLSVKIVAFVPNAFSSLASIADSVYNYQEEEQSLEVSTEKSVLNAGEAFAIQFTQLRTSGTYAFAYECTEGVSVEVRDAEGGIVVLACDTPFMITDANSFDVRVESEKNRFTDVPYTLTFTSTESDQNPIVEQGLVTIVNASIPTTPDLAEGEETASSTPEGTDGPTAGPGEVAGATTTTPTAPVVTPTTPVVTPAPTTPRPPQYQYVETVTYSSPVSNPNGSIDLQVSYKAVGTMKGKVFTPKSSIDVDETGAIQFIVKNIGTKTSNNWTYEAELPSGIEYSSGTQKPLKPQESAVITIGFDGIGETGTEKFGVEIDTTQDVNSRNDAFTWSVRVTD